jgi:putative cardiolipin synthase
LSGFRLLPTAEHAFEARLALAHAAQRSIDEQYYHVHDDTIGVAFLRSLREAARRGVRVRLLVDDFHAGDVFEPLIALNAEPGVEVRQSDSPERRQSSRSRRPCNKPGL